MFLEPSIQNESPVENPSGSVGETALSDAGKNVFNINFFIFH